MKSAYTGVSVRKHMTLSEQKFKMRCSHKSNAVAVCAKLKVVSRLTEFYFHYISSSIVLISKVFIHTFFLTEDCEIGVNFSFRKRRSLCLISRIVLCSELLK
jgi:hypothetical protein